MIISTVFKNGPSTQAVRIPKEYRFDSKEVWIERVHDGLIIRAKPESWDDFFSPTATTISTDFDMSRRQQKPSKRKEAFK